MFECYFCVLPLKYGGKFFGLSSWILFLDNIFKTLFAVRESISKMGDNILCQTEQLFWSRKKFVQKKQTFWVEVLDRNRKTCFLYNLFVQLFWIQKLSTVFPGFCTETKKCADSFWTYFFWSKSCYISSLWQYQLRKQKKTLFLEFLLTVNFWLFPFLPRTSAQNSCFENLSRTSVQKVCFFWTRFFLDQKSCSVWHTICFCPFLR